MLRRNRLPVVEAKPLDQIQLAQLKKAGRGSGVLDPTRTATDPAVIDRLRTLFMGQFSKGLTDELAGVGPGDLLSMFAKGPVGKAPGGQLSFKQRFDDLVNEHTDVFQRLADAHERESRFPLQPGQEMSPLLWERLGLERQLDAVRDEIIALLDLARKQGVRHLTTGQHQHRKAAPPAGQRQIDPFLQALTNAANEGKLEGYGGT